MRLLEVVNKLCLPTEALEIIWGQIMVKEMIKWCRVQGLMKCLVREDLNQRSSHVIFKNRLGSSGRSRCVHVSAVVVPPTSSPAGLAVWHLLCQCLKSKSYVSHLPAVALSQNRVLPCLPSYMTFLSCLVLWGQHVQKSILSALILEHRGYGTGGTLMTQMDPQGQKKYLLWWATDIFGLVCYYRKT